MMIINLIELENLWVLMMFESSVMNRKFVGFDDGVC